MTPSIIYITKETNKDFHGPRPVFMNMLVSHRERAVR